MTHVNMTDRRSQINRHPVGLQDRRRDTEHQDHQPEPSTVPPVEPEDLSFLDACLAVPPDRLDTILQLPPPATRPACFDKAGDCSYADARDCLVYPDCPTAK